MIFNQLFGNNLVRNLAVGMVASISLCPVVSWGQDKTPDEPVSGVAQRLDGDDDGLMSVTENKSSNEVSSREGIYERYVKGKLSIGTRGVYRILTNSDSGAKGGDEGDGTFLGTIYALDEEQNCLLVQPFLTYYFNKYLGFELAYDNMEAKTLAIGHYSDEKNDGSVSLDGPTLTLQGRYLNHTSFTPYAGMGLGFFNGNFDAEPAWELGYNDPADYVRLGSPTTLYGGRYRQMEVDNTVAFLLTAGTTWKIYRNWSVDLSAEYIQANADATFLGYVHDVRYTKKSGSFPMDNVAFRMGIVYEF